MHECYVCQRWQAICFLYQPVTDQSSFVQNKKKSNLKENYRLSGSFESLMMHYGGREQTSFQMMDLTEYVRFYGHCSLQYHIIAHNQASNPNLTNGMSIDAHPLRRQATKHYIPDWETTATDQFYIPSVEHKKMEYRENWESLKLYVDLVKPTAKLEIMSVSSFSSDQHEE